MTALVVTDCPGTDSGSNLLVQLAKDCCDCQRYCIDCSPTTHARPVARPMPACVHIRIMPMSINYVIV